MIRRLLARLAARIAPPTVVPMNIPISVPRVFDPASNVHCIACAAQVTMGELLCEKDKKVRMPRRAVARG
jgi:hypothetical protein